MLPFGIGFSEVLLIVVVFLLVVGPKRLPDVAKTAGKGLRMIRKAGRDLRETIDTEEIRRQVYQPIRQWEREQAEAEEAELVEEAREKEARAAKIAKEKAKPAELPNEAPAEKPAGEAEPEDDGPAIVARTPLAGGTPLWTPGVASTPGKDDPDGGPQKPG